MYRLLLAASLLMPCVVTAQDTADKIKRTDTSQIKEVRENSQQYLDSVRITGETQPGLDDYLRSCLNFGQIEHG